MRVRRWPVLAAAAATMLALLPSAAVATQPDDVPPINKEFRVEAVSTRPELVSGGDVLVRVDVPRTVPIGQVRVTVDGADVTTAFRHTGGRTLLGLVDGLAVGDATLDVNANGRGRGRPWAELELVNHPITGPVLYGPQADPFFCEADAFGLAIVDPVTCSTETRVTWRYRTTGGAWSLLDPNDPIPADVAATTTTTGATVPFIVRMEEGTINRAVYQIAVLDNPTTPGPDPWTVEEGWNRRLVYTFGGGCNHGWHQGRSTGGVLDVAMLERGYAVASATLNVLNINCNDVVSAETALMVKEHFIETVGIPEQTIGWGGSGGAIQQYLIAENYPGLLNGIIPGVSFPDATSILPGIADCRLMVDYFANDADVAWTQAERTAVSGFATWNTCLAWHASFANRIDPDEGCDPAIPPGRRYDAATNPDGLRCTVHDYMSAIFGTDPATGFARRALDNVGLQYGLNALLAGDISAEQFVDLNADIGGYDVDANIVAQRTVADVSAVQAAYATGRITSGAAGLAATPIIDFRIYLDPLGDIHDRFRSFTMRQRLVDANGHAANQVIWASPTPQLWSQSAYQALGVMDQWLTAAAADSSDRPFAEKVVGARPSEATDGCWLPDGTRIDEPAVYGGTGICDSLYPAYGDPRLAAGSPLANNVVKCSLKPLDPADYPGVAFTAGQWSRLEATFPNGVCDWTQPGAGQLPIEEVWRVYPG